MRQKATTTIVTYGILGLAGATPLVMPDQLPTASAAGASPSTISLNAIVRDFPSSHADFDKSISGGNGHYAGNVMPELGPNGAPSFVGLQAAPLTDFQIVNSQLIPNKPYAAMITIVGSAINYGGSYDMPVTVRGIIGSTAYDVFGNYNTPVASNVNKAGNPRSYVVPTLYPAGTPINISGTTWNKKSSGYSGTLESHWQIFKSLSTTNPSPTLKVLRDGDSAPSTAGFLGQLSAKQFLAPYIDTSTQKVRLKANQVIYLFELGTTDLLSLAADFQDLVVLVTLGENAGYLGTLDAFGNGGTTSMVPKGYKVQSQWRDASGRAIPPHLHGTMAGDVAGSKGTLSTGGISSAATFDQWFADTLGVNMSGQTSLQLTKNNGVWEYMTDEFHPIDNILMGNEGAAHNHFFTMNFGVNFTHHAGESRFIEFEGDDDVWVYIDGKLVMDLGGITPGVKQYLNVDRIPGLVDGGQHRIEFFYAQRQEHTATFNLRTNLDLGSSSSMYTVSGSCD